jgi:hypothetical protein
MLSLLLNALSTVFTRISLSADVPYRTGSITPIAATGIDRSLETLDEPGGAAMLILLLLAGWAVRKTEPGNDAGLVLLRLNDSPEVGAAQQIVAREPR